MHPGLFGPTLHPSVQQAIITSTHARTNAPLLLLASVLFQLSEYRWSQ